MNLHPEMEIIVDDDKYNPMRGSEWAGAFDLRLCVEEGQRTVKPGEVMKFKAGFKINMLAPNIGMFIIPRSGQGTAGLHIANQVGLIDADYQGNVIVALRNITTEPIVISDAERVGQAVFMPLLHPVFKQVKEFSSKTARGEGGFGSTGTK